MIDSMTGQPGTRYTVIANGMKMMAAFWEDFRGAPDHPLSSATIHHPQAYYRQTCLLFLPQPPGRSVLCVCCHLDSGVPSFSGSLPAPLTGFQKLLPASNPVFQGPSS